MKNEKGFTLLELLIVIAIVGIVTVLAGTAYIGVQRKAARSEASANLENLRLLEEQFNSENGVYTGNLGGSGINPNNTGAQRDLNVGAIQVVLPRFQPGNDSNFVYWIVTSVRLPNPPIAVPFNPATVVAVGPNPNLCFVAIASGIVGTRVDGDVFAIDCNNNRNF